MPRYSCFVALVLAGTTILVACGSNSPDATSSSNAGGETKQSAPTIAEFAAAADKLTESEQAAAVGDLERAGEAQGEALWSLEAKAQEHFRAMHVPFRVCWVE